MNHLEQLKQKRAEARDRGMAILDGAEGRSLTAAEQRDYRASLTEMDRIGDEIRAAELAAAIPASQRSWRDAPAAATNQRDLTVRESVRDWVRAQPGFRERQQPLCLGKTVRGLVTGRWDGAQAERDAISSGGTGGFLIDDELSSEVVDLARAAAVTQQLGAVVRPFGSGIGSVPTVESEGTPVWHVENVSESSLSMTFGARAIRPRTLMGLYRGSVEMFEDSDPSDLADLIRNSLARTMALEMDRVSLRGSGVGPEPLGIRYSTTGADPVTIDELGTGNGASITLDAVSEAASTVAGYNFQPTGIAMSVRDDGGLSRAKTGDGAYFTQAMWPSNIARLRTAATTAIPTTQTVGTSSDCAELYVGQWDQLMVALRTGLTVEVLREGTVDSVSMASSLGVAIRAYMRADIVLKRGTAFCVLTGVRAA